MQVSIVGFDQAFASPMVCLMDIFQQAERLRMYSHRQSDSGKMAIRLVSVDGKPIVCQNNLQLNVHGAVADVHDVDILIVTSINDAEANLSKYRFLVDWLNNRYQEGTALAGICTGAFLLAETGLLDGKEATTHWTTSDLFKQRYPRIRFSSAQLTVNPGDLYCADGKDSAINLAYYLVEKYLGHTLARGIARFFAHDFQRVSLPTYAVDNAKTAHNDVEILRTQRWIEYHLAESFSISDLSEIGCMSRRTFERRFKSATGDTPIAYLQRMRVEAAKRLLETSNRSFDEIAYSVGYRNSGSFRKIFVKWVSLLPSEYRNKFWSPT